MPALAYAGNLARNPNSSSGNIVTRMIGAEAPGTRTAPITKSAVRADRCGK